MLFKKLKARKRLFESVKTFSVAFLLLLYIGGNVQVESFHQVFHSLEKALHSSEQEKDACHRAIYHESKNESCDHKTHVTAVKKCPLCHVVPLNEQHLAASHSYQSFDLPQVFNHLQISFLVAETYIGLPSRGPPVS